MLRSKLENMQALVSAPTQYKGRLSELLSQMRMQRNQWNLANTVDYALDPGELGFAYQHIQFGHFHSIVSLLLQNRPMK